MPSHYLLDCSARQPTSGGFTAVMVISDFLAEIEASNSYIILTLSTYRGSAYLPLILLDHWLVLAVDKLTSKYLFSYSSKTSHLTIPLTGKKWFI